MLKLRGSPSAGFVSSAKKWLSLLDSNLVIHLYENIRKKSHECNGYVVSTNGIIHNATRSSTNAILLGNHQQSCNSLFYVVPYICKNKVSIESVLVSLERAQLHVEEHPSVADDTGTDKRTIQHIFTHVINELSRSMKLSDTQVALYLLNMGTEVTSDSFCYFGADYCVNYFLEKINNINNDKQIINNNIFQKCDISEGVSEDSDSESNLSDFIVDDEESSFEDSVSSATSNFSDDEDSLLIGNIDVEELFTTKDKSS